jgi:type II secretory pathway pseudopilin PulG
MRRAVTLIELLIVLSIIIMVTTAAIPVMAPAIQNRRLRESSRLVSTFISGARARAVETGRPFGVMFEREPGQSYCMRLSYVEVPQAYSGDTINSRLYINLDGAGNIVLQNFVGADALWNGLLKYGDLIRVDSRGPLYFLASAPGVPYSDPMSGQLITTIAGVYLIPPSAVVFPPMAYSSSATPPTGVSFEIYRQPVRSSSAPMQFPEGVVIDLLASCGGTAATSPAFPAPVLYNPYVTFGPGGSVAFVGLPSQQRPSGSMYFLVGKREGMPDASKTSTDENMYDAAKYEHMKNFWVAISQQGRVTVAENGATSNVTDWGNARQFALQGQSVGGR